MILAIISTEFTEPTERAKAMSAYIFVVVSGGSIGLLVGGVITQFLNWRLGLLHQRTDRGVRADAGTADR